MTPEKVKKMLDACYLAKRIRELLPELPNGVAPSYIQYLDTIRRLEKNGRKVKISDISEVLELPRPGVTRTVREMEEKGYLRKLSSDGDGRITYITATPKGEELSERYDKIYFSELSEELDNISDEEADGMISAVEKFYKVMSERKKKLG